MALKYVIGIDEVGRGSLAGPVMVAAACVPVGFKMPRGIHKFADSKKLSVSQRNNWFEYFKAHPQVKFELGRVYPRRIETINISQAANAAALSACFRLIKRIGAKEGEYKVILDGGLFVGKHRKDPRFKTVIKGDEKFIPVKIASIMAKVSRDRGMARLARKYPVYGLDVNKGYGTALHLAALRRHGPADIHRKTFISL